MVLVFNAKKVSVGADAAVSGTLATRVTMPTDVPAGPLLLALVLNGTTLVTIPLSVLGPNQSPKAKIEIVYRDVVILAAGAPFTLRGEGFDAGQVRVSLDDPDGTPVGTVTAGADGDFTADLVWPSEVAGKHDVVATQSVPERTIEATTTAQAAIPTFLH